MSGRRGIGRRLVVSGTAVAVVGLLMTVCSSSSPSGAASTKSKGAPLTITAVLAESGTFGAYGAGDAAGAKAEVALINKAGGVLGQKVKLQITDDQSTATTSAIAAQQFASQSPLPSMMLAGATSVEAAAILPITTRAHIVSMAPLGTDALADPATYPYNFTTVQDATLRVPTIVKAFSQLGVKKVGLISSNDTGATTIAAAAAAGLPKAGLDVVGSESVPLTTTDMSVQLQQLEQEGAKAIYAYFTTPSLYVTMMNNVGTIGWQNVKVVGSESALTASVMTGIPANVSKQFVVLGPSALGRQGSTLPANVNLFVNALVKQGGTTTYLYSSMLAADAVVLTAWAAGKAKSTNSTKILAALNTLHGVTLPASVRASLLAMPPPKWSSTNHGLAGANVASIWTLLEPSAPIRGTYQVSPLVK